MLAARQAGITVDWSRDGVQAENALTSYVYDAMLLDLGLPRRQGLDVLRNLRKRGVTLPVMILTARDTVEDRVRGLDAGADDYLLKPVDPAELRARLRVGERVLGLQNALESRVRELEEAARQINELRDLLPICCYCKKVRDDQNFWHQVEKYITHRTGARISHGICPACFQAQMDRLAAESEAQTDDKGKKV